MIIIMFSVVIQLHRHLNWIPTMHLYTEASPITSTTLKQDVCVVKDFLSKCPFNFNVSKMFFTFKEREEHGKK